MAKAAHHHALARQWELLRMLPTRPPGISASELANKLQDAGFVVSKRTIERDLIELSSLFGIACNDKGMPYGWYWMNGEPADLPGISITDAVSLNLIEEFLRPLVPSTMLSSLEARFRQARQKLEELAADNKVARWIDKVRYVPPALALLPPEVAPGVLEAVQTALLEERQLQVEYLKPAENSPSTYQLHPLGIAQRGAVSYLVATAFDYQDVRLYAIHRIVGAEILDQCSRTPIGFKLDRYVEEGSLQFGKGRTFLLEARISDPLAYVLRETPLSRDQCINPDGHGEYHLTATVQESWQLRWWILSQGENIELLSPDDLREEIRKTLSRSLARYRN